MEKSFAEIHAELDALNARFDKLKKWLDARYKKILVKAHVEFYPRKKVRDLGRIHSDLPEFASAVHEKYSRIASAFCKRHHQSVEEIEKRLRDAVEREGITPSPMRTKVAEVWESTYSTQGLGSAKYTKADADNRAEEIRRLGLTVEVVPIVKKMDAHITNGYRSSYTDYEIYAGVSEAEARKLRFASVKTTLREWIKSCWGRGVNPRVFNPFLPNGLEEQLGLDYFGGETKAATT